MIQDIFKKIGYGFFTLFGVATIVFLLFNVLPGDPARMMLDERQDHAQLLTVKKKFGFDKPIATQYLYYLNDISLLSFHSSFEDDFTYVAPDTYHIIARVSFERFSIVLKTPYLRRSFQKNGKKVGEIIAETLPNTAILAIASIGIALMLGLFLGVLSALWKDSFFDNFIAVISTFGMSLPSFLSAIIFAWLFGFVLKEYTHLNMTGSLYEVDDFGEGSVLRLRNLILPASVLGIRPLAVVIQLMRNSLLEVLSQDYIRTARAKGLNLYEIVVKHALKNAMNPVVTAVSGWFASMLAGAVFVEYVFNWNGLGKEIVEALNTLDQPVIMGAVLVIASLFILINIVVDLLYGWLDPKIRLG